MALTTPDTAVEVVDRAVNDVELALAPVGGKPSLKNSWFNALIVAFANRIFDFYFSLDQAALEALPDTAVDNLERWAAIFGITRIPGAASTGNAIATGVVGSTIPAATVLATGDGKEYAVRTEASIAAFAFPVPAGGLTRVAQTATCELSPNVTEHNLANNVKVTITGADQSEYNVVNAEITITSKTAFTYQITGTPATPATGTIFANADKATLVVDAEVFAASEDQISGIALKFISPIVGVEDTTQVDFDAIGGGADRETDTALRDRLLDRIQNPIAHFNVAEITAVAKGVAGVTRVFVEEITPAVGQVTIYFMRDNDATPIPDGAEVAAVDAVVQAIRPATSDSADVIVSAPTAVTTSFTFTALTPNTASMKTAVENSLKQFYAERTSVGVNVDEDAYRSAIFNTVDPTNGDVVSTFTLSAPTGDIAIAAGEIGVLGNVTFS